MSHSQALSPLAHPDVSRKFVHDAKHDPEVASTTSHDPCASHRHTPDFESESDEETTTHATPVPNRHSMAAPNRIVSSGEQIPTGLDRTGPRVRFRSRVRISAGMGRRRRLSDGLPSNTSSISGSPSSSISAPLRTHYTGNNGWGPLGSRVNLLGSQAAPLPPSRSEQPNGGKGNANENGNGDGNAPMRCARSLQTFLDDDVDEHTHLTTPATRHSYVGNRYVHDCLDDDGEQERRWREQLVDEAFGKWPGRLLNRHWWWWHLEPILCCFCEPDEEQE